MNRILDWLTEPIPMQRWLWFVTGLVLVGVVIRWFVETL